MDDDTPQLAFTQLAPHIFDATRMEGIGDMVQRFMTLVAQLNSFPVPDAERAGERFRVWTAPHHIGAEVVDDQVDDHEHYFAPPELSSHPHIVPHVIWSFTVTGEDSGRQYGEISIGLAGKDGAEPPFEFLGLALQVALNGPEHTTVAELSALQELQQMFNEFSYEMLMKMIYERHHRRYD